MKDEKLKNVVNFLFEVGILAKTPRSGFYFLGSGEQSVAEHTNRTVFIGYALATMEGDVDVAKVIKMCLFHDLPESRTSDLNYVHQKYAKAMPEKVLQDLSKVLPFGKDIKETVQEYEDRDSSEAIIAKDSDNLEWVLSMKEQVDTGNSRAKVWMKNSIKRLRTDSAKALAKQLLKMDSEEWFTDDVSEVAKKKKR